MATITLSVPEKLKKSMDKYPEINWAELSRQSILKRLNRSILLHTTNEILKDSKLTRKDAVELGNKVKQAVAKRYGLV